MNEFYMFPFQVVILLMIVNVTLESTDVHQAQNEYQRVL